MAGNNNQNTGNQDINNQSRRAQSDGGAHQSSDASSLSQLIVGAISAAFLGTDANNTSNIDDLKNKSSKNILFKIYASINDIKDAVTKLPTTETITGSSTSVLTKADIAEVLTSKANPVFVHVTNWPEQSDGIAAASLSGSSKAGKRDAQYVASYLQELFNTLKDFENESPEKYKKSLYALKDVIGGNEASLKSIIEEISNIYNDKDSSNINYEKVKGTAEIINSVISILSFDTKVNEKGLRALVRIVSKGGSFRKIIEGLSTLEIERDTEANIYHSLQVIDNFFSVLLKLNEFGLFAAFKMSISLSFIEGMLLKRIPALMDKINKEFKDRGDIKQEIGLRNLYNFFNAIMRISEIDIKDRIRFIKNLFFIKHFVTGQIASIINHFNDEFNEKILNIGAFNVLDKFFDKIFNIINLDAKTVRQFRRNVDRLYDIIIGSGGKGFTGKLSKALDGHSLQDLIIKFSEIELGRGTAAKLKTINQIFLEIVSLTETIGDKELSKLISTARSNSIGLWGEMVYLTYIVDLINGFASTTSKNISNINKNYITPLLDIDTVLAETDIDFKDALFIIFNNLELLERLGELINLTNELNVSKTTKLKTIYDSYLKPLSEDIYPTLSDLYAQENVRDMVNSISSLVVNMDSIKQFVANINEIINLFTDSKKGIDPKEVEKFGQVLSELYKAYSAGNTSGITLDDLAENFAINPKVLKKFSNTIEAVDFMLTVTERLAKFGTKAKFVNKLRKSFKILEYEANLILRVVEAFTIIDKKQMKYAANILKQFQKLLLFGAAVILIGGLIMSQVDILSTVTFTGLLIGVTFTFVYGMKMIANLKYDQKMSGEMLKTLPMLAITVGLMSTILILVAKYSDSINFQTVLKSLLVMIGGTAAFVVGLIILSKLLKKIDFADVNVQVGALAKVILLATGALFLGALLASKVDMGALFGFTIALSAFIIALGVALLPMSFAGEMQMNATELGKLLLLSTAALMIGALFMMIPGIDKYLFAYAKLLALFTMGILLPFIFIDGAGGQAMQGAESLGKLLLMSTAALMIGALFMMIPGIVPYILGFAALLVAFNALVVLPFIFLRSAVENALEGAKNLAILVGVSALALMIGALFVKFFGAGDIFLFGIILGGFMLLISIAFAIIGRSIDDNIKYAWQFALLIAISALALTLGPILLNHYGVGYMDILKFAALNVVYIFAMGLIMKYLLGNIGYGVILKAVVAIGAIGLLTYGMAYVFGEAWKMMGDINWEKLLKGLGWAALVMAAIGVVAFAIGSLMTGPQAIIFAAGAAVLGTLEALVWGIGKCVLAASIAIKSLQSIEGVDTKKLMVPFADFISEGAKALGSMSIKQMAKMKLGLESVKTLGKVISEISKAIQEYAQLKVAIYDNSGKKIGFRSLTEEDFESAATNIAMIITCVGGAIMGLFGIGHFASKMDAQQQEVAMEMLKVEPGGLFRSRKTKFGMVVEACAGLGKVITEIAKGTQEYIKLPKDFDADAVSRNVATIITTLGRAIMDVYYGKNGNITPQEAKDMFDTGLFESSGNTPFNKVVRAMTGMGIMLHSIMMGIQSYANLKFPSDWDSEGKPIKYEKLTGADLVMAAFNIGLTIKLLGKAVSDVAEMPSFKYLYDPQRLKNIFDAINSVCGPISTLAQVIYMYSTMQFPGEIKDGKVQGLKRLYWRQIIGGMNNIKLMLKIFAEGIMMAVYGDKTDDKGDTSLYALSKYYKTTTGRSINNVFSDTVEVIKHISNVVDSFVKLFSKNEDVVNAQQSIASFFTAFKAILGINDEGELLDKGTGICQIVELIYGKDKKSTSQLKTWSNGKKDIIETITNIDDIVNKVSGFVSNLKKIPDMAAKYQESLDKLKDNKSTSDIIIAEIQGIVAISDAVNKAFTNEIGEVDNTKFDTLDKLLANIERIVEIDKEFGKTEGKGIEVLKIEFEKFLGAISKIKNSDLFDKHTNTMNKYVSAVNKVSINKIHSLTNLVDAINQFGHNFGNIDDFVTAVVDRLTDSLTTLSKRLNEAKSTMDTAEAANEKRKKLIDESVKTIKDLLEQELTVNVKSASMPYENPDLTTETDDEGNPITTSTGDGNNNTETTPSNDTNPLDALGKVANKAKEGVKTAAKTAVNAGREVFGRNKVVIDSASAKAIGKAIAEAIKEALKQD